MYDTSKIKTMTMAINDFIVFAFEPKWRKKKPIRIYYLERKTVSGWNLKLQIFSINTYGAQGTNTALHFQGFMYKYRNKSLSVTEVLCTDSFN